MRGDRSFLTAVAALAGGVLTLQITLTRIFSVTTQYHFAFLSVSLALFGLAAGGLVVRLAPRFFKAEDAERRIAESALLSSLTAPALLMAVHSLRLSQTALPVFLIMPAVPFTAAGIALAAAYTRRASDAGRVYGADLAGAALGCAVAAPALSILGGPGAMLLASFVPLIATLLLGRSLLRIVAAAWGALLVVLSLGAADGRWLSIEAHKNPLDATREYEAWNSFSRIAVMPMPEDLPLGWGMDALPYPEPPPLKLLNIDGDAATLLVGAGTGRGSLDFLLHDLTSFALGDLPENARVLIVGSGGGKDILAALHSGAALVRPVEVNPLIVETVNEVYGDFTGRPYSRPGVDLVLSDARTYLASDDENYDRIVLGLVDSWSATASGAFFLTENHLYTSEAFATYLDRLSPDGIASISRWRFPSHPSETLRAALTARVALETRGIENPLAHLVVLARTPPELKGVLDPGGAQHDLAIGVVLMKRSPFTAAELDDIQQQASRRGIDVLHAGDREIPAVPGFRDVLTAPDLGPVLAAHALDVSPVSDDRPFFFQMLRMRDFLNRDHIQALLPHATFPAVVLVLLGAISTVLAAGVVLGPLALAPPPRRKLLAQLIPFIGLGAAYFFVEVALVERMVLLVGDPTRALALVLGTLLVGTAAGGYHTRNVPKAQLASAYRRAAGIAALAALVLAACLTPLTAAALEHRAPIRLPVAAFGCLGVGFLLGRPFPIALRALAATDARLVPWAWATNGALGVAATVFSIPLAMALGFRAVLVAAALAYGITLLRGLAQEHPAADESEPARPR